MAIISLLPRSVTDSIISINLGSSNPPLSGTVDISFFPNLTSFNTGGGISNNFVTLKPGFDNCPNLTYFYTYGSYIPGDFSSYFSTLSSRINLTYFNIGISHYSITGSLPPLTALTNLQNFSVYNSSMSGSLPVLPNSTATSTTFRFDDNYFSGPIPPFGYLPNLALYYCFKQNGSIKINGTIPSLSGCTNLNTFWVYINQLSGFNLNPVPKTLKSFDAHNNYFTLTGVYYCLSAFATMVSQYNTLSGTINLGGPNMPALSSSAAGPINGAIYSYVNYLTASPQGWSVTLGSSAIPG